MAGPSPSPPRPRRLPRVARLARVVSLPRLCVLAIAVGASTWLAAGARAADDAPIDLAGTWYVLVHYRDPGTANPDADRWKDLVWVFERAGTRLAWTEYPIVVFEDTTGRFEARDGNPRARVLAAWEPNAEQSRTLDAGPRVNQRGKRSKSLRGSDAGGWRSPRRPDSAAAMTLTYHENLAIEGLDALPRFVREDVLGNALESSDRGGTTYTVERVEPDRRSMSGRYDRDGRQKGTFRMWRTEPVRGLSEEATEDGDTGTGSGESRAARP